MVEQVLENGKFELGVWIQVLFLRDCLWNTRDVETATQIFNTSRFWGEGLMLSILPEIHSSRCSQFLGRRGELFRKRQAVGLMRNKCRTFRIGGQIPGE
jgi:hypothetical protein